MKWITRKNVKVDRVACPWPIGRGYVRRCIHAERKLGRMQPPAGRSEQNVRFSATLTEAGIRRIGGQPKHATAGKTIQK